MIPKNCCKLCLYMIMIQSALCPMVIACFANGGIAYAQSKIDEQREVNLDLQRQVDRTYDKGEALELRVTNLEKMDLEKRLTVIEDRLNIIVWMLAGVCTTSLGVVLDWILRALRPSIPKLKN